MVTFRYFVFVFFKPSNVLSNLVTKSHEFQAPLLITIDVEIKFSCHYIRRIIWIHCKRIQFRNDNMLKCRCNDKASLKRCWKVASFGKQSTNVSRNLLADIELTASSISSSRPFWAILLLSLFTMPALHCPAKFEQVINSATVQNAYFHNIRSLLLLFL